MRERFERTTMYTCVVLFFERVLRYANESFSTVYAKSRWRGRKQNAYNRCKINTRAPFRIRPGKQNGEKKQKLNKHDDRTSRASVNIYLLYSERENVGRTEGNRRLRERVGTYIRPRPSTGPEVRSGAN